MKRLTVVLGVVFVLALAFPATAFAEELQQGEVVFGGSYALEEGETLHGDLVIFGGSAVTEPGSEVDGNIFIMGGTAVVEGTVTGDVAVFGGNVDLRATAVVQGTIASFGGNVSRAPGAIVEGDVVSADELSIPFSFDVPFTGFRFDTFEPFGPFGRGFSPIVSAVWFGLRTLLIAALAVIVGLIWPRHADRVGRAVAEAPVITGGLGLLTLVVAPLMILVAAITILLLPVAFVALIALVVAIVFGWIGVGVEVGNRLADAFDWEIHEAASAGIGTLLLSLVASGIALIPCCGWILVIVVASAGLGSVIMTVFGTRDYPELEDTEALPAPTKAAVKKAAEEKAEEKKDSAKK